MKRSDVVLGGVAAMLGAAVFLNSLSFPPMSGGWPGPGFFPEILGVLLVVFGGVVLAQGFRPHDGRAETYQPAAILKAGLVLVSIAFYAAVVQKLGFLLTATLVVTGLMLLLGVRVLLALPAGVAVAVFCLALFEKVLRVPLPPGMWGG